MADFLQNIPSSYEYVSDVCVLHVWINVFGNIMIFSMTFSTLNSSDDTYWPNLIALNEMRNH